MSRTPEAEAGFGRLFGEDRIEALKKREPKFEKDFNDLMITNVGTGPWSRGILTQQQLSISTLSLLAASGHFNQFEAHVRLALTKTGVQLHELRELLIHLTMYCGMPVGTEIHRIVRKVMRELGISGDMAATGDPSVADRKRETPGSA